MSRIGAPRRVSPPAEASPPALAERLVARALGRTGCVESVLGDLHEEYARVAASRRHGAILWYWLQAARLAVRFAATRCVNQLTRRAPPAPADPHGDSTMQTILLEARHALRALRKRPLPTATVVLTLSLCLGANAAVFAVIDALVIRPFHFPDVDRIAFVYQTNPRDTFRGETVSPANLLDWRRQATTIQQLTGLVYWDVNLVGRDEPERVQGFRVSPDFFAVMRVQPALGRGFTTSEETAGNHRRVVLGHGLWQRRFGADPSVLGVPVDINGEPYEVVGVAPRGFDFPMGAQLWVPFAMDANTAALRDRRFLSAIGRLAPGRTLEDAQVEMATIAYRLGQQYPDANRDQGARVLTLTQGMQDEGLAPILSMWQASALFVLLIGCANVANLLLARAAERELRAWSGSSSWKAWFLPSRRFRARCLRRTSA